MPRREVLLGRHERDRLILALAKKDWTHERIGRHLGMSRRGVGHALERLMAAGKPPGPDADFDTF